MGLLLSIVAVVYALTILGCLVLSVGGMIKDHFAYLAQCERHKQELIDRECRAHQKQYAAKYWAKVSPLLKGAK